MQWWDAAILSFVIGLAANNIAEDDDVWRQVLALSLNLLAIYYIVYAGYLLWTAV